MLPTNTRLWFLISATIATAIAHDFALNPTNSDSNNSHVARSTISSDGTFDGCNYQVQGAGTFTSHFSFDFTTMDTLPSELIASTYEVGSGPYAPYAHLFEPSNIILGSGQPMKMIVPGAQTADPLSTCQLVTRYNDVIYASVRTVAQVSPVNGTVHGFFMYMNDTQETDIEIRTGDPGNVHFTNQQTHYGMGETTYAIAAPDTMLTAFHEYRYDWLPDMTNFYIDGVLVKSISRNVPSMPGWLMWNNWANGFEWTYGPPLQDNVLLISSVEAYFNRTAIDTSHCQPGAATSTLSSSSSSKTTSATSRQVVAPTNTAQAASTAVITPTSTSINLPPAPMASLSCPNSNNTIYTEPKSKMTFSIECDIDHLGGDILMAYVSNLEGCIAACAATYRCVDVSMSGAACYMKQFVGANVANKGLLGARLVTTGSKAITSSKSTTTSKSFSTAATYSWPSFEQLLQLHIDARLVVPTSV